MDFTKVVRHKTYPLKIIFDFEVRVASFPLSQLSPKQCYSYLSMAFSVQLLPAG